MIVIRPVVFFFYIVKIFHLLKKFKIDIFISQCGGYGDFRSGSRSILIAKFLNFPSKNIVFIIVIQNLDCGVFYLIYLIQ